MRVVPANPFLNGFGWARENQSILCVEMKKALRGDEKKIANKLYEMVCKRYLKSAEYEKGDKKYPGYKYCCEMIDYCSFYKQTWFYLVCAGVALLLIIIGIVISVCLCCRVEQNVKEEVDQFIEGNDKLKGLEKTHREGNIGVGCSYFTSSKEYKTGNTKAPAYRICCELVDYCSFYKQTWFYLACAGGVLLLIIVIIVVACCCCRKGRGGGGKDGEAIEETTEEEDSNIH